MNPRVNPSGTLEDAIKRIVRLAEVLKRPCAIIGGAAMVLRVRPRPTFDVDLVIEAARAQLDEILDAAAGVGLKLIDEPHARELAEEGLVQLDGPDGEGGGLGADLIFVDSPFLSRVVQRATVVEGPFTIPVATPEDLLLLKLEAGRPVDLDDAIAIKDVYADTLDRTYLAEQGELLGLRSKLENLLGTPSG
jgi:hypothetical protein